MKKYLLLFLILMLVLANGAFAQYSRYFIRFKDKGNNPYSIGDPSQFLSQRSIDRRSSYNIPIDSSDLPVNPAYIDSIRLSGNVIILNKSKWLNMICIKTTDASALAKINSFPFVVSSAAVAERPSGRLKKQLGETAEMFPAASNSTQSANDYYNYGHAYTQIHLNNGDFLHNHGFKGEQMQMAVLDVGFMNYKTLPIFDSVRNNNQILGTWDFVANDTNINEDASHGIECFSTIAANMPGQFVGTAPKASYYLFLTEDINTESIVEELNWATAAECADSVGVNIISTSLGYNTFDHGLYNHTYSDMNGNISICARAVDLAAQKGILALCAVGNSGQVTWHYLTTPADADSCLAVGSVDAGGQVSLFSSYGPSSDGQIKPDVAAMGFNATIVNASTGQPSSGFGTSYATPILAGITTCLWQAFPEVNNMVIIDAIRKSSNQYANPDDRSGYGIPDAKKAFVDLIKRLYTKTITLNKCNLNINWSAKCAVDMNFAVERKLPGDADYATLSLKTNEGSFANKNFSFQDDLSIINAPSNILYRIKMNIAADTSFYLDSFTVNYTEPCIVYTFIGNGNWDVASNWNDNGIPPDPLPAGSKIIVDPVIDGECILNVPRHIPDGTMMIIKGGKKFRVEGSLEIQEN